jgi:ABC-type arginine transport system permease subunit
LDRPAAHLPSATATSLGIFSLVVGLPYFILWRSYRKAFLSFVSAEDEILVSRHTVRRSWMAFAAFIALGALFLALAVAVALLVRPE